MTVRRLSLLLLAFATIGAVRVAAQQPDTAPTPAPAPSSLAAELERCKELNEKAASDERCEEAYKANRKLFFVPPSDYQPKSVDPFPSVPNAKDVKSDASNPNRN